MALQTIAFWGLLGAFVYAAPRMLLLFSAPVSLRRGIFGVLEFLVALIVGTIGAAGFASFVGGFIHQTGVEQTRAIALVVGMIANPVSPTIVHVLGTGVVRRIGASGLRVRSPRS